ncbi:MAG: universal stress protein [Pseudomonadota bacterium]
MPIKDILVACDGSASAAHALAHGTTLAKAIDAHLTGAVVHAISSVLVQLGPWITEPVEEVIRGQDDKRRAEIRAGFDQVTGGVTDHIHYLDLSGAPEAVLAETARLYDLLIVGGGEDTSGPRHFTANKHELAAHCGGPLMVVPPSAKAAPVPDKIVLAWDGKPAASRALTAALPLMTAAREVSVLTVGGDVGAHLDQVRTHLFRHGVTAESVHLARGSGGIGATLLDECSRRAADLLVMGAYEHPKLAEDVFGGVTDRILREATLPVLMVH